LKNDLGIVIYLEKKNSANKRGDQKDADYMLAKHLRITIDSDKVVLYKIIIMILFRLKNARRMIKNMEKEDPTNNQGGQKDGHHFLIDNIFRHESLMIFSDSAQGGNSIKS